MEIVTSSGLLASSAVVCAVPCKLHGITIVQASAACTAIAYDNATTNTGLELEQINNTVNSSTNNTKFNNPATANNGIYIALTGTGAKVIVHYSIA